MCKDEISVRLCHRERIITFANEGMESEMYANHLVELAKGISQVTEKLRTNKREAEENRSTVYNEIRENLTLEHVKVGARLNYIQKQQETLQEFEKRNQQRMMQNKQKEKYQQQIQTGEINKKNQMEREERLKKEMEKQKKMEEISIQAQNVLKAYTEIKAGVKPNVSFAETMKKTQGKIAAAEGNLLPGLCIFFVFCMWCVGFMGSAKKQKRNGKLINQRKKKLEISFSCLVGGGVEKSCGVANLRKCASSTWK